MFLTVIGWGQARLAIGEKEQKETERDRKETEKDRRIEGKVKLYITDSPVAARVDLLSEAKV